MVSLPVIMKGNVTKSIPRTVLTLISSEKLSLVQGSKTTAWSRMPDAILSLSHRIYLLISFRKSNPTQNRQLIVYYY
jgi:hypothetical protein